MLSHHRKLFLSSFKFHHPNYMICSLRVTVYSQELKKLCKKARHKIKMIIRYHLTQVRWLLSKKPEKKCWRGYGETVKLVHCSQNVKWYSHSGKFLKTLNIELPCDPAIPLLGLYPKEVKQGLQEVSVHSCSKQHYSQ